MATRYPTGVRALLAAETAERRRVENALVSSLESARFDEVVVPIIDYADPYASLVDRGAIRQSYRFVDREGELVALRSDFTPMVARALAPSITATDLPLRLFYRGDVVRCGNSRLGANREMFQVGAEIVGDASVDADIEAIRLAVTLLGQLGLSPVVVCSDDSILDALIRSCGGNAAEMRSALASKRSLRGITRESDPLLERVAAGLARLDELESDPRTAIAAGRMKRIASSVDGLTVHLDDIDENPTYYTGLRFRIYCGATRSLVAQGGRYDALYARFGHPAPAVGFTITVDDIRLPMLRSEAI